MKDLSWIESLRFDPLPALLSSVDPAVRFFTEKDLLETTNLDYRSLWELPLAQSIVRKQQSDGSWLYPGGNPIVRSAENYNQLETFRNVGYLVELFGFSRSNPVIANAAEYLFSFQTAEGDIRGILGNQYTPYYTATIAELLIKAGYEDKRIEKIFMWLSSIRQNDGGWAIPLRTVNKKLDVISMEAETLEPDRTKPFSHMVTGIVLRAYAAHPTYRYSSEVQTAGKLLLSQLFKRDSYADRADPSYWLRFTYPFWFTDLLSALDSLGKLGFTRKEPEIQKALTWFIDNQQSSGLWKLKTLKNQKKFNTEFWLSLAICRMFKRYYTS